MIRTRGKHRTKPSALQMLGILAIGFLTLSFMQ